VREQKYEVSLGGIVSFFSCNHAINAIINNGDYEQLKNEAELLNLSPKSKKYIYICGVKIYRSQDVNQGKIIIF